MVLPFAQWYSTAAAAIDYASSTIFYNQDDRDFSLSNKYNCLRLQTEFMQPIHPLSSHIVWTEDDFHISIQSKCWSEEAIFI